MSSILYQHYSFDLWQTLIKSDLRFKSERVKYFFDHYNFKKKTFDEISQIFRHTDVMCNHINESTGKNIDSDEMYLMIISQINNYDIDLSTINTENLHHDMECLFFDYPPLLYSEDTAIILTKLKENHSLSILSNTGFIRGKILRKLLNQIAIGHLFDFQLYSDEVGISKPNSSFFKLMLQQVTNLYPTQTLALSQIIHIGDNPKADIQGAQSIGIEAFQINSNHHSIKNLLY